jgi:hypothetical protein
VNSPLHVREGVRAQLAGVVASDGRGTIPPRGCGTDTFARMTTNRGPPRRPGLRAPILPRPQTAARVGEATRVESAVSTCDGGKTRAWTV